MSEALRMSSRSVIALDGRVGGFGLQVGDDGLRRIVEINFLNVMIKVLIQYFIILQQLEELMQHLILLLYEVSVEVQELVQLDIIVLHVLQELQVMECKDKDMQEVLDMVDVAMMKPAVEEAALVRKEAMQAQILEVPVV